MDSVLFDDDTLQLLSKKIDDPATDNDKKATYLHQRVLINYEKKKWIDVIDDIEMFEQINDSNLLTCMKIQATVQECCRVARLSVLEIMTDGNYTNDHEKLLLRLSQKNVDKFVGGVLSNKKTKN